MEEIDLAKTIAKKKLIYKSHWLDFFEILYYFIFPSPCVVIAVLLLLKWEFNFDSICIFLFCNFILQIQILNFFFRRSPFGFRRLYFFNNTLEKIAAKRLLYAYFKKKGFEYDFDFKDENYYTLYKTKEFFGSRRILIFIFLENKIIMNFAKSSGRFLVSYSSEAKIYVKEIEAILQSSAPTKTDFQLHQK